MRSLVVLLCGCGALLAADWLGSRGDPQLSGWQKYGKEITPANVKDLKLLWKLKFGPTVLSGPVIMGPAITHRGVRELVFVADFDNLYAVDADLGTLFWKRHFDVQPPPCGIAYPPTPVIEPDPDVAKREDDEPGPMRPLYAVSADGWLHTIRVSDGADSRAPIKFLPPKAHYSNLNYWSGVVYSGEISCGRYPQDLWSIDVKKPDAKPQLLSKAYGQWIGIGPTGKVYGSAPGGFGSTVLDYRGRELLVGRMGDGRLRIVDARDLSLIADRIEDKFDGYNGVASWADSAGIRWIYGATGKCIRGFQLTGPADQPKLELVWTSVDMANIGAPVVANGVVLTLSRDRLEALDAASGRKLYSSVTSSVYNPELAVANSHVCFTTGEPALSCYGIPMER